VNYRAVVADELGPVANYRLRLMPRRPLATGEVRIGLRAAGVGYVDCLTAAGNYQVKPPVPFVPGSEAAGVVIEIGSGVEGLAAGDRVVCGGWNGLFAEECIALASWVAPIPDSMDFPEAAVFRGSFSTAWHALVDRANVQPGETVVVLGAGGATGHAAVQVARHLGARVIGSASSEAKRALARAAGAHAAVDSRAANWREALAEANGGKAVDVVFDPVGGSATEPAFRSLGWNGRHLVIGFTGGMASLKTNLPLLKGASLIGVNIRDFLNKEPEKAAVNNDRIFELATAGVLAPKIAQAYPIEDFAEAMSAAARGESAGRIIMTMG